jgi:CheY-like chemotaxis protein
MVAKALGRLVARHGRVTVLNDARDALLMVEAGQRFDIILCEARLPVLTGAAFHQTVARSDAEQARRIVFMTWDIARGPAEHETLEKPIAGEALERVLRRFLD